MDSCRGKEGNMVSSMKTLQLRDWIRAAPQMLNVYTTSSVQDGAVTLVSVAAVSSYST